MRVSPFTLSYTTAHGACESCTRTDRNPDHVCVCVHIQHMQHMQHMPHMQVNGTICQKLPKTFENIKTIL